jgi:hypothetical protein
MSNIITYWEKAPNARTTEDFDGLLEVRIKRTSEIPALLAMKPPKCAMISIERSGHRKDFRVIWREGEAIPEVEVRCCPLCKQEIKGN